MTVAKSTVHVADAVIPTVVDAWAIVVGPCPSTDQDGVVHLEVVDAVLTATGRAPSPSSPLWHVVQPRHTWLLVDADAGLAAALTDLGARVDSVAADAVGAALIDAAAHARAVADAAVVDLMRENTILRRELNRALSALGPKHQILGLMPSTTIDDLRAERRPSVPMQPHDRSALMTHHAHPYATLSDVVELERETMELRDELAAIENTRVMRWSRMPRQLYRRLRGARPLP